MSTSSDDQFHDRLHDLNADLTDIHLPGPAAARHRATQRTRNQITGVVLASAVLAGLGILGVTQDQLFTAPDPAAPTDTASPTAVPTSPDGSDETAPPDVAPVPDDALMTLEDVAADSDLGPDAPVWAEADGRETPFQCVPMVPESASSVHFANPDAGHFLQFIEATADPVSRFSQLRAEVESCAQGLSEEREASDGEPFTQAWTVNEVGDEAWMANYFAPRDDPDEFLTHHLVSVRLMRVGGFVTMVARGGPSPEDNLAMSTDDSEQAARRLCAALEQDCVGQVVARRAAQDPVGDIPGWLADSDLAEVLGADLELEGWEIQPGNDDATPPGWGLAYLAIDPADEGAVAFDRRHYGRYMDVDGPSVYQELARFASDDEARQHYAALVDGLSGYTEDGVEIGLVESSEDADHVASVWLTEHADTDFTATFGLVTRGNAVALLNYLPAADATADTITDEELATLVLDLLTRAAARLATN
ncbi:hypothetical protein [Phytoactinopolyspora limicola]|uniref:hypothetical protein n=1 Tax=Phytoactinopolyspora limicola TaxID=2715536 RepID=UPI00140C7CD7|nr:hypothetical protein [Phytoactinopolyspora limicola]